MPEHIGTYMFKDVLKKATHRLTAGKAEGNLQTILGNIVPETFKDH